MGKRFNCHSHQNSRFLSVSLEFLFDDSMIIRFGPSRDRQSHFGYFEGIVRYRVSNQAVREGIIYVTEDRKIEGFFENMSIGENLQVAHLTASKKATPILRLSGARKLNDVTMP